RVLPRRQRRRARRQPPDRLDRHHRPRHPGSWLPPAGGSAVDVVAARQPRVPGDTEMTTWPSDPVLYELNTAAWLHDVGLRAGVTATLADVPADEWDRVTPTGVDAVWLMGVWERGRAGVELAMGSPEQVASFRAALPDFR